MGGTGGPKRNPGFDKDPKGLIVGFRHDRVPASLLAASIIRRAHRPLCFLEGGQGSNLRPQPRQGWGIIGAHASPFLFGPLHCSSCHHLMLSPSSSVLLSESTRPARGALRELSEPYPAQGTALESSCLRWDSEALLYFMRLPCVGEHGVLRC